MKQPAIYLCGTMTQDARCLQWRKKAHSLLAGMQLLDPVDRPVVGDGLEAHGTIFDNGRYVERDRRDIEMADAVLLCWWGEPGRQSIGTWCEMGWATAMHKPLVVCDLTDDGYNLKHPFVYRQAAATFSALEDAAEYLRWLLRA